MRRSRYAIILPAAAMLFVSCLSGHRIAVADIDPVLWKPGECFTAHYLNSDTVSVCDLSLLVRFSEDMPVRELTVEVGTLSPDSLFFTEEVVIAVGGEAGRETGAFREMEIPYRCDATLARSGTYTFSFTLPPDSDAIKGIATLGIIITPR